jgi:uncharacterized repeat protein (TIGR02543 family)
MCVAMLLAAALPGLTAYAGEPPAAAAAEGAGGAPDDGAAAVAETGDAAEAGDAGDAQSAAPADLDGEAEEGGAAALPSGGEAAAETAAEDEAEAAGAAPVAALANEPAPIINAAQPWQSYSADTGERLNSLIEALTLDEKVAIAGGSLSAINRLGVNGGRGGGGEGLHGVAWDGQATMFPSSLGLSQSFDTDLLESIGDVIAKESLAGAIGSAGRLAPVVDLLRDPRYGRAYETLGEDAYLTGSLGTAMANGMSARTGEDGYIRFIPILKHFMAYNAEINRLWVASSISPRNIAEYYIKAFKYPVSAGASKSLMNSYPVVAGKPMSVSPLQRDLLTKWTPEYTGTGHYEYLTTNDYGSGSSMWVHSQRYFEDTTLGRALGIAEGTKNGQMGWSLRDFGATGSSQYEALARGMAKEEDFEENAKRAVAIALRTGDLDQIGGSGSPYLPNADNGTSHAEMYGTRQSQIQKNKGVALQASQEQIVLLKNEDGILPLDSDAVAGSSGTGVALLGPLADQILKDVYSGSYKYRITIYDALRNTLGAGKIAFNRAVDTVSIQAPGGAYLAGGKSATYVGSGSAGPAEQNVVAVKGKPAPALGNPEDADRLYRLYDYGSENILLQSAVNDRYLQITNRTATQNAHTLQNNTSAPGEGNLNETPTGQNLSYSAFQKFRLAPADAAPAAPYTGKYGIYSMLAGDGINDGVGLAYDVDDEDLNRGSYVAFNSATGTVVTRIPAVEPDLAADPAAQVGGSSVADGTGYGGYPWRTEYNVKSPVDSEEDSDGIVDRLASNQKFTFTNVQSVEQAADATIAAADAGAPVILVVGYEPHMNAREGMDLYKTGLSPQQTRLVEHVTGYSGTDNVTGGLNKGVVLVVKTGNPMAIDAKIKNNPNVRAIIVIGHTGQEEGSAIVSALFDGGYSVPASGWYPEREYAAAGQPGYGNVVFEEYPGYLPEDGRDIPAYAPAGRLSATWYDGISQMPGASEAHAPASYVFPNYDEADNDNLSNMNGTINTGILTYDIIKGERTYQYQKSTPLYPFGYGLTYTDFAYSDVEVAGPEDGKFTVTGKVKNIGAAYASDEVVQVYSSFAGAASRIAQPVKRLVAYDRVKGVAPGDEESFSFEIDLVDMLGLWDVEIGDYIVEPGNYTIAVGSSSAVAAEVGNSATLTVTAGNGGTAAAARNLTGKLTLAENMDDYSNVGGAVDDVEFVSSSPAYDSNTAIQFRKDGAWAAYKNVTLAGETSLAIRAGSDRPATVSVHAVSAGTAFTGSEGAQIASFAIGNTRPSGNNAVNLGIGPVAPYPGSADGQITAPNYEKPALRTFSANFGALTADQYDVYVVTDARGVVLEWLQFDAPSTATGVSISNLYLQDSIREQGGTLQLVADLAPVTATSPVAWSVVNKVGAGSALASIDSKGLLTAAGAGNGTVTVTATAGAGEASATKDILVTNQISANKAVIEDVGPRTVEFMMLSQQSILDLSFWIPGFFIVTNFSVSDSISKYRGSIEQTAMFSELLSEHAAPVNPSEGNHEGYYLPGDVLSIPADQIAWELKAGDGVSPTTLATISDTGVVTAAGTEDGKVTVVATLKNNPDIVTTRAITLQNQGAKDGSVIIQAENFDVAPGTAALAVGATYQATAAATGNELGLYAQASLTVPAGGHIGDHGEALTLYKKVDFGTDADRLYLRTSAAAGNKAEVWIDAPNITENGVFLGLFDITATGAAIYETQKFPLNDKISGVHDLYIRYHGPDAAVEPPPAIPPYVPGGITTTLNVNWLQLGYVAGGITEYCTLSFDAQGGAPEPADQSVAVGGKAARPVNPTMADYAFVGWYETPEGDGAAWDFDAREVTGDTTLFAKWILNPVIYTATFDTQGGTPEDIEPQALPEGSFVQRPEPDPAKDGYTFGGWFQAADGSGDAWQFTEDTLAADITLFAKWIEIVIPTYTVAFDSNGGTAVPSQTVESGGTLVEPQSPARAGYVFAGWHIQPDLSGSPWNFGANAITADITLYAAWALAPAVTPSEPSTPAGGGGGSQSIAPTTAADETSEETPEETTDEAAGDEADEASDGAAGTAVTATEATTATGAAIQAEAGGRLTLSPDGSITVPDGTGAKVELANGATIAVPGGTLIDADGGIHVPFGSAGATVLAADGTTASINGGYVIIEDPDSPLGYSLAFDSPFADVASSDWFFDDVGYVALNGLFNGTAPDLFAPNAPMTRGMVVTVLGRLHGADAAGAGDSGFTDVSPDAYYAPFVAWARASGIVLGISETEYAPDREVSRQDMATILNRYAQFAQKQFPVTLQYAVFADEADIAGYASGAVQTLFVGGIINGKPGNLFDPQGGVTRAEVAAMLSRFAEAVA